MDIKETINDTIVVFKLIFHPQNTTDRLFILGSIEKLGNWNLPDAVELINNKETPNTFTTTIVIPENTFFEYKYYVQRNDVIIEEKLRNRRISSKGFKLLVDDGHFCSEDQSHEEFSAQWVASSHDLRILFGHPQPPDSRGEIFRFFQNKEFKIKEFIVHTHNNKTRIIRNRNIWNDKQSSKDRFLFNENNNRLLHDEFEELALRTDDFNEFECIFSLFSSNNEKIGTCCITSSMIIKEKCGILALPIISIDGSQILGEMNLEYLLVTPFIHEALGIQAAAAASSSRSFWKSTEYLYCGHRGMGANNAKSKSGKKTIFNENTILSFNTAASIGTQYVEFDVQLTKDNIPVVFHDFSIGIPTLQSKSLHIPIASLTLHELQSLFFDPTTSPLSYPTSPDRCSSPSRISDDYSLERKFYHGLSYAHPNLLSDGSPPSLDDVFRSVNANIGFNIEVKYPSDDEKKRETPTIQERNLFIDKILDVVHAHFTSQRNIFFSSFDPQSCILLSLKQPHYPVFFLTEAGTEITCDPRRNSLLAAAHFAKSHYLLGIVSNVKPILQDPSIISSIKREGLMLITYGGDNNELENIKLQEENGIDAIISDFHLNPRGYFPVFRHQASSATPDELLPTAIQQKQQLRW